MKLFFIAGEDSGDLHTSNLIEALRKRLPQLNCRGVGGDKMAAKGVELIAHVKDINFMGFAEVVSNLSIIRKLFRDVESDILDFQPDAVILVDYPGFNLRMAKFLKQKNIKTIYYISPQVWAWKKRRVKTIQAFTDKMMVILPFEKEFYQKQGLEVDFVGHPLLDVIQDQEQKQEVDKKIIALLPGSRKQEISRMLPTMLEIIPHFPEFQFIIAGAPSQSKSFYEEIVGDSKVGIWMNQTYALLESASYAVVTSGTATLETALFKVPEVVVYKGSKLSYSIGKRLVQVDFISLVNLILERKAVEELIQNDFNKENLIFELKKLMEEKHKKRLNQDYEELWQKLGSQGASERAADVVLQQLGVQV
ncbi:MAG: lipid-A-disaccharide synthase [Bacteroidia bacterium]|nr:lipid-A-disaccharide synthase [Bacteroidia bacterium]